MFDVWVWVRGGGPALQLWLTTAGLMVATVLASGLRSAEPVIIIVATLGISMGSLGAYRALRPTWWVADWWQERPLMLMLLFCQGSRPAERRLGVGMCVGGLGLSYIIGSTLVAATL